MTIVETILKYMGKIIETGAGSELFDKLKPEPHKNRLAPQNTIRISIRISL
jgi:hypothetical protein